MNKITIFAPTKINIVLRVTGRRSNGYHDLLMLNEKLKMGDDVTIEIGSGNQIKPHISISCDDGNVPCDETNICYKAAKVILDAVKMSEKSVRIDIKKRIPVAAGLGGGSSDAAAVLKGMNKLLGSPLTIENLAVMGVKLGADVPFFLYDGPAICEGIGDKITTLKELPNMSILLINPSFPVSTKWVYEEYDNLAFGADLQLTHKVAHASLPCHFKGLGDVAEVVHNDLELVTAGKFPEIKQIEKMLMDNGALKSWMSGSGPTVIGMFEPESVCKKTADSLRLENPSWRVIETANFKP